VVQSGEINAQLHADPSTPGAASARFRRSRSGDLTDENIDVLAEQLSALGARAVAAAEGLGTRTLLRRLAESGTSVRSLVLRVRRERALRLLATSMPSAEVARAIGFSSPISLARFCRREFGTTPGRLRAGLVGGHARPHERAAPNVASMVNRHA
jgi:AraC-like DNA-binding protein